jgi:uncharacterized lipoprotein YajG
LKILYILTAVAILSACSSTSTKEDMAQELTVDEMLLRDSIRADSMKAALLKQIEEAPKLENE